MTQMRIIYNRLHKNFLYDGNMRPVKGYTLSINRICDILHCTRAYVHHDIQQHVRFVKIPVAVYSEATTAKQHKEVKTDALSREYIHRQFLLQEGVIQEGQKLPDDWMSTVWFDETEFIKWFNQNYSAFRRTQPATIARLFPYHQREAQEILDKMVSLLGKKNTDDDFDLCLRKLEELAEQCKTQNLLQNTLVINRHAVITDKTSKVPFMPIYHRVNSIDDMQFLTVADFNYPSKATKYFERTGAICFRANNRKSGKTLYLIPTLTDIEQFLLSPSYLYVEHTKKDD